MMTKHRAAPALAALLGLSGLLAASALVGGCGGRMSHSRAAAAMPAEPAALALRPVIARGRVEVEIAGTWRALPTGGVAGAPGVTGVRAAGRGAVLALGDGGGRGTLWLRGGARAALAQTADGAVHVALAQGQARVRVPAGGRIHVHTPDSPPDDAIDASGQDVLVRRTDSGVEVASAAAAPDLAAWSLALADDVAPAGIGQIEAVMPDGAHALLELRALAVTASRAGDYAFTEVEHTFYNPSDEQLEGKFRFPLPAGAMPLGLAMEIDGKMMEGEIVEKERARKVYEEIVDKMLDPALLEWEEGNRFSLRVFPIEPRRTKRVVFRYAAPLVRSGGGWEYVYPMQAPELQERIPRFELSFDGAVIEDSRDRAPGADVVVPVAEVPVAMREELAGEAVAGVYTAVRVRPDWTRLGVTADASAVRAADAAAAPRRLVIVFDTSRSTLESRPLAAETLELVVAELTPADRFAVLASDLTVRGPFDGLVAATPEAIAEAVAFVTAIEPDGASDLGAALVKAGELARASRAGKAAAGDAAAQILYIGDGTATWGETRPAELRALAARAVASPSGDAQIHAAILGKGASLDLWRDIAGERGGRAARPRTRADARRLAFFVAHAGALPRLDGATVKLEGDGEAALLPTTPTTLFAGDELTVVIRTPAGAPAPTRLTLSGRLRGEPVAQSVAVAEAAPARLVSQRWAVHRMAQLEASEGDVAEIVALSRDFGVMSKHTSLLVLESEEAYRQYGIERRRGPEGAAGAQQQVSGGDLDSLDPANARLSPDEVQPGDPEIIVPAPADAREVTVMFPFGDTKLAVFDPDLRAWVVRFLIDKDTPDGKYTVLVRITHADGRVQSLRLPYVVDTRAPIVNVSVTRRGNGYLIVAREKVTRVPLAPIAGGEPLTAQVREDAARVELYLPGGRSVRLLRDGNGQFSRTWKPARRLTEPVTLRVVASDRALNQRVMEVVLSPDGTIDIVRDSNSEQEAASGADVRSGAAVGARR